MTEDSKEMLFMNSTILDYIGCPRCKGALSVTQGSVVKLIDGVLECEECKSSYEVKQGVPILLTEISEDEKFTARNFGEQWDIFRNFSEGFENQLVADFFYPWNIKNLKDKTVLEAGCGFGRNLLPCLEQGADLVIGFDISPAVFIAKERGLDVVIGDILNPPFRNKFDVVFSFGVLQHVSDPEQGIKKLYDLVKPDGMCCHTVYSAENNEFIYKFFNPLRERLFRHFPSRIKHIISFILGICSYVFFTLLYRPFSNNPKTDAWASNRLFYYEFVMLFLKRLGLRAWICQIYDHLNAPLATYFPRKTIDKWIEDLNLNDVYCYFRNQNTWNFGGRKS